MTKSFHSFQQCEIHDSVSGAPHPYKAQYLRLTVESDPADIMDLFESVWNVPAPKLIITVHGGMTDFE